MNASLLTRPIEPRRFNGLNPHCKALTIRELEDQNSRFKSTGGISQENRSYGFLPAFLDRCTGAVYLSRFGDGRVAPIHLFDRLPSELVAQRTASGKVSALKGSVVAGFVHHGRFYTRAQAAEAVREL